VDAINSHHRPIAHLFCTQIGLRIFFIEPDPVGVLLDLLDRGIIALPVHDAVIVRRSEGRLPSLSCARSSRARRAWGEVEEEKAWRESCSALREIPLGLSWRVLLGLLLHGPTTRGWGSSSTCTAGWKLFRGISTHSP
jgi:hypothetical protein